MRPKNQRLVLVIAALAAVMAAVLLAMWGLRDRASYFYTPADIAAGKAEPSISIRLGGMVERKSVVRQPDGITIRFVMTDGQARTPVIYRGIVPFLVIYLIALALITYIPEISLVSMRLLLAGT